MLLGPHLAPFLLRLRALSSVSAGVAAVDRPLRRQPTEQGLWEKFSRGHFDFPVGAPSLPIPAAQSATVSQSPLQMWLLGELEKKERKGEGGHGLRWRRTCCCTTKDCCWHPYLESIAQIFCLICAQLSYISMSNPGNQRK